LASCPFFTLAAIALSQELALSVKLDKKYSYN